MPVNKITSSNRARAAIASVVAMMVMAVSAISPGTPPAVTLAVNTLIKPWEGIVLSSHWDRYAKIYDICYGETVIDGKPVPAGMRKTKAQCDAILDARVERDYFRPIQRCIRGFDAAPLSVQAMLTSGAYNFGVGAACRSTAAKHVTAKRYRDSCLAMTAFNRAGGQVVNGLVKRREMGDAQRIGEAELCVSGL